ncbi:MAG: acetolactate synthase, large subunit, biosynthetic type [Crocinitomicaceae bacterium]|nr:acetolactate synthase, large subunit, biosynthetic type [Crocinitomicaceae bacterium]
MNKITGSKAVIKSLLKEKVDTIFGYPGGAIMPIYDSLYGYKNEINHVLVRHEQGAIHAAQGYARSGNKCGVVFATSGPGATNLITGLADAMIDSTPVVCITGQVHSSLLGTDAFQETDVIGISMPVTKWNIQITNAKDIPFAIAKAFYIANSGRPGPVLIDITKDAQFDEIEFSYSYCNRIRSYKPTPKMDYSLIKNASEIINIASKPLLLIGQGIILSQAEGELLKFVNKSGIPVASTLLGLGSFPNKHPNYVGYLGMHGNYAPNIMTNECDVLIAIGMRFDDRVTGNTAQYAKQAKVIHVDIDKSELNKIIPAEVAIHADAKKALSELIKLTNTQNHSNWIGKFKILEKQEYQQVIKNSIMPESGMIKMAEVINFLSKKNDKNTVIITDVGQHQMITSRYYKYNHSKSNITSGGLGTMGFALPAAIGAKLAAQKKNVIAIIGDGGFQMNIQELGTIMQSKVDVKVIILNNNFLGMVRQWQEMFFDKRYSFTDIQNPNFIKIAEGYGIKGKTIKSRDDLNNGIETMLKSKGSFILEVICEHEENVFPMVKTGSSVSEIILK